MNIQKVTDHAFGRYGRVLEGYDLAGILKEMEHTPLPKEVIYVPSVEALEALPEAENLKNRAYGGLPIQIGYCNGDNHRLNALEYHRSSEINIAVTDMILLLGAQQDIEADCTYDTSLVEAFFVPAGTAVEMYATTLHYAPCSVGDHGFRVAIVLPKDTNLPLEEGHADLEDRLITAKNKWLIGHAEGGLPEGSHIGLIGKNLDCRE